MILSRQGLRILSWNAHGVAHSRLDDFCFDLSREYRWDILLLQEFSRARADPPAATSAGHLVYSQPFKEGQQRAAIVVHADKAALFFEGSWNRYVCARSGGAACWFWIIQSKESMDCGLSSSCFTICRAALMNVSVAFWLWDSHNGRNSEGLDDGSGGSLSLCGTPHSASICFFLSSDIDFGI